MELKNKKIAVIIAHPDDETIGCGGFISKASSQGAECKVILALKRENQRDTSNWSEEINQFKKACKYLGAEPIVPDSLVSATFTTTRTAEISLLISSYIDWADIVLCHWKDDTHHAHQAISNAVELLTRPFRNPKIVLCFETATSTEQGFTNTFSPNCFITLDERDVNNKKLAMEQYRSEICPGRTPDDLELFMRVRGSQSNAKFAEAYYIARYFIK